MVINPIVGVYIPIIRIPFKRWDHPGTHRQANQSINPSPKCRVSWLDKNDFVGKQFHPRFGGKWDFYDFFYVFFPMFDLKIFGKMGILCVFSQFLPWRFGGKWYFYVVFPNFCLEDFWENCIFICFFPIFALKIFGKIGFLCVFPNFWL